MTIRIEFDITCLCPMYSTCYFHSGISQDSSLNVSQFSMALAIGIAL